MNKFKENIKKIWSKITESRLNLSMFIAGVIAVVLMIVIIAIIISRDGEVNNELMVTGEKKNTESATTVIQTTSNAEKETTVKVEEQFSTKIDENATTNVVSRASRLSAKISVKNSWTNDGEYFIQYNLEVTNVSDEDIDGWAVVLDMSKPYTLVDSWNYTFKEGYKKLVINPFNDNRKIPQGETVTGGFIVKESSNVYVDYITVYVGNKVETIKNANTYIPSQTTEKETTDDSSTTKPVDETTKPEKETSPEKETTTVESESTTKKEIDSTTPETEQTSDESDTTEITTSEATEITTSETTETPAVNTSSATEIITSDSETTVPITE